MPRKPRTYHPGDFFHVYNRGVAKLPIVHDDQDRRTFMKLLGETVEKFRLHLFAYCLMDNHYHLFVQILEANLPEALWHFSLNYCRYFNERHERVGPVYQDRYQSRLVNCDAYAFALTRYIHQNPMEARMVTELHDYTWSSYGCYTKHLPLWNGINTEWILKLFAENPETALDAFIQFHRQSPSAKVAIKLSRFRASLL